MIAKGNYLLVVFMVGLLFLRGDCLGLQHESVEAPQH